jgi:2-methylisocitrate lyase-like PEP mutase family enzyme
VGEAIERGRLYLDAGADCIYPIMVSAEDDIAALTQGIPGPVNTNAIGTKISRLAELGVARVSFGPMPYLKALDALKSFATGLRPE